MDIVIAGGSGQIGRALISELISREHSIILLTRNPENSYGPGNLQVKKWDGLTLGDWCESIENSDVVINLSGASIAGGRWTKSRKKELLESRTKSTGILVKAITLAVSPPPLFINASAVGYYGNTTSGEVNENSDKGSDFLSDLCGLWEKEAMNVKASGIRVVILRTGIVLEKNIGALRRIALPFKVFAGGYLGSGSQWISWIHIKDLTEAVMFILENKNIEGPVNLVSPEPVTARIFAQKLGEVLHRPSWFPIPSFLLRIILGEMSTVILNGQRTVPEKLISAGFKFNYPTIKEALDGIFAK